MKKKLDHRYWFMWVLVFIAATLLAGCGTTGSKAAQDVSPTATEVSLATIPPTPVQDIPTATVAPPVPTASPDINKPVKISYMEADPEASNSMTRYMNIYRPDDATPPYPTVFIVGPVGRALIPSQQYKTVAKLFVERGYAAILLSYVTSTKDNDFGCALSWVNQNADAYNLNLNNLFALGHINGGLQVVHYGLSATDNAYHQQTYGNCPYPYPGTALFKSIAVYDPGLAILEGGSLEMYSMPMAYEWNMEGAELLSKVQILKQYPADKWIDNPEFDEATRKLVHHLPVYWLYNQDVSQFMPPILFIDSDADKGLDFVHEVSSFTKHMDQQGLQYQVHHLEDVTNKDLIASDGLIAETIVELVDKFYKENMD